MNDLVSSRNLLFIFLRQQDKCVPYHKKRILSQDFIKKKNNKKKSQDNVSKNNRGQAVDSFHPEVHTKMNMQARL